MEYLLFAFFFGMLFLAVIGQKITESRKPKIKSIFNDGEYINKTSRVVHRMLNKYPKQKPITKMDIARRDGINFYG